MSLAAGDRLGAYEIVALLGAGGMGEVYRARDPRLGRDVAIKVLPASVSDNPDRVRRFEQEARAAGALNHPNILAVYDVGTYEGTPYVVSELLEGQTLGKKMAGRALPLSKALDYAIQVARGLAAAHAKGIVHRDLKPENLFVTDDGHVKILDFGLAKLTRTESDPGVGEEATVSTPRNTTPGAILGTAGYMAPEQVRGLAADHRADIFSFGAILYELLVGRRAFQGDTAAEAMVAILKEDPLEVSATQRVLPPGVERILRRCLEKTPEERFQSARDLAFHLEAIPGVSDAVPLVKPKTGRLKIALWTLAGLLVGGLMVGVGVRFVTPTAPTGVTRFTITLPEHVTLGFGMALSPDGRTLVYSGTDEAGTRLYRRALDTLESVPIRGTDGGQLPFFSPDGASVGFSAGRALTRVPLQGGAPVTVVEAARLSVSGAATWLSDDTIIFGDARGLMRVAASGGTPRRVTDFREAGEVNHRWPVGLPGDRAVLFTAHYGAKDSQRVHVVSLESGQRTALVQGNGARFLPPGHVVFQRGGSLWVAPFDQTRLELTASPTAVVEGVAIAEDWSPLVAAGRDGSLAYATGGDPYPPRTLVWVDRTGREQPIEAPARAWFWPHISPDGRRIGFHDMDPVNMDVWIYELDHGPLVRMTFHPLQDGYPLWTPDGKHIVFWSRQGGGAADLYVRSADLTGGDRRLTTSRNITYQLPFAWADGGKLLVFQQDSADTKMDIAVVPIEGGREPTLLIRGPSDEARPAISSNGRWIAYESNVSGRLEVYVQPFPDLGGRWQVSTEGGISPIWHPNGRELFYRQARAVMSVPVDTTSASFRHGNPTVLFEGSYVPEEIELSAGARSYALAPDGKRFLMMKERRSRPTQIVVVLNWVEELKRLAR